MKKDQEVEKEGKDVKISEEDDEDLTLIGYVGRNVIRKHPYDNTASGYMLNDCLFRNVDDKRKYRKFYICDKEGKKIDYGHMYFLCREPLHSGGFCNDQKRSEYYHTRITHKCKFDPKAFENGFVKRKKKMAVFDNLCLQIDKKEMSLDANPILDSVCRLFMDCAYAFRSVESSYFKQMLIDTVSLTGSLPPAILAMIQGLSRCRVSKRLVQLGKVDFYEKLLLYKRCGFACCIWDNTRYCRRNFLSAFLMIANFLNGIFPFLILIFFNCLYNLMKSFQTFLLY
jgi:hypothetical protein